MAGNYLTKYRKNSEVCKHFVEKLEESAKQS